MACVPHPQLFHPVSSANYRGAPLAPNFRIVSGRTSKVAKFREAWSTNLRSRKRRRDRFSYYDFSARGDVCRALQRQSNYLDLHRVSSRSTKPKTSLSLYRYSHPNVASLKGSRWAPQHPPDDALPYSCDALLRGRQHHALVVGAPGHSPRLAPMVSPSLERKQLEQFRMGLFAPRYGRQAVQATPTASSILSTGNRNTAMAPFSVFRKDKIQTPVFWSRPATLSPASPDAPRMGTPRRPILRRSASSEFSCRPTFLDYRNSSSPKGLSGQRLAKFRVALLTNGSRRLRQGLLHRGNFVYIERSRPPGFRHPQFRWQALSKEYRI